jgi:hypothetical protein
MVPSLEQEKGRRICGHCWECALLWFAQQDRLQPHAAASLFFFSLVKFTWLLLFYFFLFCENYIISLITTRGKESERSRVRQVLVGRSLGIWLMPI